MMLCLHLINQAGIAEYLGEPHNIINRLCTTQTQPYGPVNTFSQVEQCWKTLVYIRLMSRSHLSLHKEHFLLKTSMNTLSSSWLRKQELVCHNGPLSKNTSSVWLRG